MIEEVPRLVQFKPVKRARPAPQQSSLPAPTGEGGAKTARSIDKYAKPTLQKSKPLGSGWKLVGDREAAVVDRVGTLPGLKRHLESICLTSRKRILIVQIEAWRRSWDDVRNELSLTLKTLRLDEGSDSI